MRDWRNINYILEVLSRFSLLGVWVTSSFYLGLTTNFSSHVVLIAVWVMFTFWFVTEILKEVYNE